MLEGEAAVSRCETSPTVRIQAPSEGLAESLAKAAKQRGIKVRLQKPVSAKQPGFARANPAARRLLLFTEESYDLMVQSMAKEIQKVLEPDESSESNND